MRNTWIVLGTFAALFWGVTVHAGENAELTAPPGLNNVPVYSDLAPGDPYGSGQLSQRAQAGHPLTQKSYQNCSEARCQRAEQRQKASQNWSR